MELLKNWIFSLCSASIAVSILKLILNESKVKKTVNVFLSLFLLFYMIAPFSEKSKFIESTKLDTEIKTNISETKPYDDVVYSLITRVCKEESCELLDMKINYKNIDGEDVIENISIRIDKAEKNEIVKSKVKDEYGFEVSVN